jgi:hypothetical protein
MARTGNYQIPFDEDGNQLHYPEVWVWKDGRRQEVQWRDNVPFEAKLTYAGFSRGRSAAYLDFTDQNGKAITFFLKDFEKVIPHLIGGAVTGTFIFTKRGTNYGCQLIEPTPVTKSP